MTVKLVGYQEPNGLWNAYQNPNSTSSVLEPGELRYHLSDDGREFDFTRYFIPGKVVSEGVEDGNINWRRYRNAAELWVNLGKEDYLELLWFEGRLHRGCIHREGKKDIKFRTMFGESALEYTNPDTGNAYYEPKHLASRSNIGREEAMQEIYQLFIAPYAERLAEYARVLDTQAPVKWQRRKGESWESPVVPASFYPKKNWLRKHLSRGRS